MEVTATRSSPTPEGARPKGTGRLQLPKPGACAQTTPSRSANSRPAAACTCGFEKNCPSPLTLFQ